MRTPVTAEEPIVTYNFIIITVRCPRLVQEEVQSGLPPSPYYDQISYKHNVEWEKINYVSDVLEVKNMTEDDKFKLLDKFEASIRYELKSQEQEYMFKVNAAFNLDSKSRQSLLRNEVLITDRKMKTFSSYKEASENRQMYL